MFFKVQRCIPFIFLFRSLVYSFHLASSVNQNNRLRLDIFSALPKKISVSLNSASILRFALISFYFSHARVVCRDHPSGRPPTQPSAADSGGGAILPTWTPVDNLNVRTSQELWGQIK
jgi:hypothetical protein